MKEIKEATRILDALMQLHGLMTHYGTGQISRPQLKGKTTSQPLSCEF